MTERIVNTKAISIYLGSLCKRAKVKDYAREIPPEFTISEMMPLVQPLSIFKEKDHVFVSAEIGVIGIITAADLSKPVIQIYLFGLISLLEMHLGFWIRVKYVDQTWRKHLKEGRISAAEKVLNERRRKDQEIDLLDCLQFCDKRDLILCHQDLRADLELDNNADPKRFLVLLERGINLPTVKRTLSATLPGEI